MYPLSQEITWYYLQQVCSQLISLSFVVLDFARSCTNAELISEFTKAPWKHPPFFRLSNSDNNKLHTHVRSFICPPAEESNNMPTTKQLNCALPNPSAHAPHLWHLSCRVSWWAKRTSHCHSHSVVWEPFVTLYIRTTTQPRFLARPFLRTFSSEKSSGNPLTATLRGR